MLMGMLDAGGVPLVVDGVRAADEDNPRGYHELERVKALDKPGDKSWLADAQGQGVSRSSRSSSPICRRSTTTRSSFCDDACPRSWPRRRRCWSIVVRQRGDVNDEDMAGMFAAHIVKTEALLESRDNYDVLYVGHRKTLEKPAATARAINEFLGGHLDEEAMAKVVDQTLYRNRT